MNKIKRNLHYACDTVQSSHEMNKANEKSNKVIISMLMDLKNEMKQFSYHMQMDSTDVSEFFPLKNGDVS